MCIFTETPTAAGSPVCFRLPDQSAWCICPLVGCSQLLSAMYLLLLTTVTLTSANYLVRIGDVGLHTASNYTRRWLHQNVPLVHIPSFTERFSHSAGSGIIVLTNVSVQQFFAPLIKYRPTAANGLIYISTGSGHAQVHADWLISYNLLALVSVPADGQMVARATGFDSDIAIRATIADDGRLQLIVDRCTATIQELQLALRGSFLADVLHLFRNGLSDRVRRYLESAFCRAIRNNLAPLLVSWFDELPKTISVLSAPEPSLSIMVRPRLLHVSESRIDLYFDSRVAWNGTIIQNIAGGEDTTRFFDNGAPLEPTHRMLDMYVHESVVQTAISGAHYAGYLSKSLSAPFLRINCDVLCIGSIVPELRVAHPRSQSIHLVLFTSDAPIVHLELRRALVQLNATLQAFIEPMMDESGAAARPIVELAVHSLFSLSLEMINGRLKGWMDMIATSAHVTDSTLDDTLSQSTVDFLVNISTPFIEDAVEMYLNEMPLTHTLFPFAYENEYLSIIPNSIRLQTDLQLELGL